jgi:hypothetical protein
LAYPLDCYCFWTLCSVVVVVVVDPGLVGVGGWTLVSSVWEVVVSVVQPLRAARVQAKNTARRRSFIMVTIRLEPARSKLPTG